MDRENFSKKTRIYVNFPIEFNDIKENTPFSDRTIRKYLNELINEGKITFTTADHNRKIYAIA